MFGGNNGLGALAAYQLGRWTAENELAHREWVDALRARREMREIDVLQTEINRLVGMFSWAIAELDKGNRWFNDARNYVNNLNARFRAETSRLETDKANLKAKITEWENYAANLNTQIAAGKKEIESLNAQLRGSRESSRRGDIPRCPLQ